jgi:hypothetical protein
MNATQISSLLADRHAKDVFVPECKMGSAGSRTLDGWALLPTWSPLTTIGYEIKVSRSDWLRDQKFEAYRSACHLFFVVAPKGIVQAGELPTGVGLLEPIGKGPGCRLVMRGKATRGTPDEAKLARLMAHVLMWRKDQRDYGALTREGRAAFWRRWVDEQRDYDAIGRSVRGRMRQILRDAVDARRVAESRAKGLEYADEVLKELGVRAGWDRWSMKRNIERALEQEAGQTLANIDSAVTSLSTLRQRVAAVVEIEQAAREEGA